MTAFADQQLEEQIAEWRAYVRRRQALHRPDVEELEGHLRDQLAALTEAGLTGDEAFLVAVKRMGSLDELSREFARAHSERLWKQLVIAPETDALAQGGRDELFVVLGLAVAAAIAVKVPALFGHPINPNEGFPRFYARNAGLFVFSAAHGVLHLEARVGPYARSLACDGICGRGCADQHLSVSEWQRDGDADRSPFADRSVASGGLCLHWGPMVL
jgi:hypothetical protein